MSEKEFTDETMPGFGVSLGITALPVVLIAGSAIFELWLGEDHVVTRVFAAIGDAPVALLIGLVVAVCYFALVRKVPLDTLMGSCSASIKSIAMIIFIIGAGGAFKQVLQAGGISDYIVEMTGDGTSPRSFSPGPSRPSCASLSDRRRRPWSPPRA